MTPEKVVPDSAGNVAHCMNACVQLSLVHDDDHEGRSKSNCIKSSGVCLSQENAIFLLP